MPVGQQANQLIGQELQGTLVPSAAVAAGTYHVKLNSDGSYGLAAGAPTRADALISAGKYLDAILDITNANGGTVQITIFGIDPASGKVFPSGTGILQSAAVAVNGTTVYRVGPALTAAANTVANDFIPFMYSIQVLVATATVTFSLGSQQMP